MAAAGLTIKSGWAAFVVVARDGTGARVLESRRVELCDPAGPETKQPYHDGFATMRREGPTLTRLLNSVRECGGASVRATVREAQRAHGALTGVGVVVGSLIDPSTIGNEHIRIHAMEGQVFRTVATSALDQCGIPCTVWRERDLPARAPTFILPAGGPWRREQKVAALAAWLVLNGVSVMPAAAPRRRNSRRRR